MSFKKWFKWWLRSLSAIMFHGQSKSNSDWQRKREKQKRREYERRRHTMNYTVKERKKARSSNVILLDKLSTFFMASLAFFFIPLGLAKRAKRSKSIHKARVKSGKHTSFKSSPVNSPKKEEKKKEEMKERKTEVKKTVTPSAKSSFNNSVIQRKTTERKSVENKEEKKDILASNVHVEALKTEKKDENAPKSTPLSDKDTYYRKRLTIQFAEDKKEIMAEIKVGTVLDFSLDESKKSVCVLHNENKIGFVPTADTLPIATALKLGRTMYAIVTEIRENELECEGWLNDESDSSICCTRMPEKFVLEDGFADTLFKYID